MPNTTPSSLNKETTGIRIREYAHWLEKTRFLTGEFHARQAVSLAKKLQTLLDQWTQNRYPMTPDIRWAQRVLKLNQEEIGSVNPLAKPALQALEEKLRTRSSCRNWQKKAVSKEILNRLFLAAVSAPTSANRQSLRMRALTTSKEKIWAARLSKQSFLKDAPVMVMIGIDITEYYAHEYDRIVEDAAIAAQTMAILAEAMGLGTCYVTPHELKEPAVNTYFKVPEAVRFYILLALGYPGRQFEKPARMPLSKFLIQKGEK